MRTVSIKSGRGYLALQLLLLSATPVAGHELFAIGDQGEPLSVQHFHECEQLAVSVPITLDQFHEISLIHRRAQRAEEIVYWTLYMDEWVRQFGPDVHRRSPPTNKKNCFGKTFDNGDSWIDDPTPFLRNCTSIEPPAVPGPGDVAVYIHGNRVMHSGRIIAPPPEAPPGDMRIWVHSQWGIVGDFDHPADQVPQNQPFEFPPGSTQVVDEGPYGEPFYYTCP